MKIAFLIWNYSPSRGGQERYLSRLIGELTRKGHEIHVFAARFEEPCQPGIHLHRVRTPKKNSFFKTLLYLIRTRMMLLEEGFDIVSGMTRFYPLDVYRMGSGLHSVWMRKKTASLPARLISYTRPFNLLALYIEGKIFDPKNCSHIIANSNLCRRQLINYYSYPANRVTVVYNGLDHKRFHPRLGEKNRSAVLTRLGIPTDSPVAIFVSMNLKRKGIETVIRALSIIREKKISLIVVGRGSTNRYRRLARWLKIADRVRFIGQVSDVRPYYGASDFLVLPTLYDPFANVCLEAMACGLPVVTTTDNGAAEIIDDGKDGFVLSDPHDAEGLAVRMATLADRDERERMALAAREKSLVYTMEKNAEETAGVYTKVLEEKKRRSIKTKGKRANPSFTVDEKYQELLKTNRLDSFEAIMGYSGGELLRDKGIRTIARIELSAPKKTTLYLKRHLGSSFWGWIKHILQGGHPAADEWHAIASLNATGIETMEAVAYGEDKSLPWLRQSFIITAGVEGNRLEDHISSLQGKFRKKRCIISLLADTVRRMHGADFNHRDLYLSHIFLQEKEKKKQAVLIDLQRVQRKARGLNRWVVKDLAALNYSSPASVISRTDRMRFLIRYLGKPRLDEADKKLLKRIARKTERIRKHDLKRRSN